MCTSSCAIVRSHSGFAGAISTVIRDGIVSPEAHSGGCDGIRSRANQSFMSRSALTFTRPPAGTPTRVTMPGHSS